MRLTCKKILGCASVEFVQRRSSNEAPARKGSYLPTLDLALAVIWILIENNPPKPLNGKRQRHANAEVGRSRAQFRS